MHSVYVAGLLVCSPLIFSCHMILALEDGHLPLGNVGHEHSADGLPSSVLLVYAVKLQIRGCAAIALDNSPIWTDVNGIEETSVIADRLEELGHSREVQNEFAEIILADRAILRNLLHGVLNARVAWVQANVFEWHLPVFDRNLL